MSICNHFISETNFIVSKGGTLVTLVVPGFWIVLVLFKFNFSSKKIPLLLNFLCGSAIRVFVSDSPISVIVAFKLNSNAKFSEFSLSDLLILSLNFIIRKSLNYTSISNEWNCLVCSFFALFNHCYMEFITLVRYHVETHTYRVRCEAEIFFLGI